MNTLSGLLSQIPPATAYTVLAAAIIAESVLLVGALVPTLALMLTAGALARLKQYEPDMGHCSRHAALS